MPLHAVELLLAPRDDAWVREVWAALAAAGLPSQARHAGATNAPHLTVLSAPALDPHACRMTAAALAAHLPAPVPVAGIALLGSDRYALAQRSGATANPAHDPRLGSRRPGIVDG